jgi:adenosylhomocysteine nucleosidase
VLDGKLARALKAALGDYVPPFLSASVLGTAQGRQPRLVFGTIVTGDRFVNSAAMRLRLSETWQAQAVEMEGAAVAQVAALSDLAGAESHMDFGRFLEIASTTAADVVRRAIGAME